ncbi:MAG: hypothetical protein WCJ56_05240 [bacterium]
MNRRIHIGMIIMMALLALVGTLPAHADAYCYLNSMKVDTLKNGVKITIASDGILTWSWNDAVYDPVLSATMSFTSTRQGMDKTFYSVNKDPLNSVLFTETTDGKGVNMVINLSQKSRVSATASEDRQSVFIMIYSIYTDESVKPIGTTLSALQSGSFSITPQGDLVDVVAVKADIKKVISELALKCNISVAVHDGVNHNISINLLKRAPMEVLQGITAGYGLALSQDNGVFMISEGAPADLSTYQRSSTASFPMKYLRASDAKTLLPSFLFLYIRDNPLQNAVVVTAPSQLIDKVGRDLKVLDTPPAMVMIECAVVELSNADDFHTEFKAQYQSKEHDISSNAATGALNFHKVTVEPGGLASAIAPTNVLTSVLQALITKGSAVVKAHPSMAAVNGKAAEIKVGSVRYISYTNNNSPAFMPVEVGTKLNITPSTSGSKEITCQISVEMSNIVQIDLATGIPRVSKRTVSTNMRALDGETIILGGLSQLQEEDIDQKVPVLGDIPLLGQFFRSKSRSADKTELIVLIRPRLLDADGHLPAADDAAYRTQFLKPGDLGYGK